MLRIITVCALAVLLAGCASEPPTKTAVSHTVVKVDISVVPFEKQVRMREGDAYEFRLPDGKTVAIWCERPEFGMIFGEQTTASGLKTAWGEHPFKCPEPIMEQTAPNTYTSAGWKSYISQGAVTTHGDQTTEYVIYVSGLRISIIEQLQGKPSLPVTIRIIRR